MDAPLWLGIYGAGMGTVALIVEYLMWRSSKRTRLTLTLKPFMAPDGEHATLVVTVINWSEHDVKTRSISLLGDADAEVPIVRDHVIAARDNFMESIGEERLRSYFRVWGNERVVAVARTATGQVFGSKDMNLSKRFSVKEV